MRTTEPTLTNTVPAVDDCGLADFPASRSTQEILGSVPRQGEGSPNNTMLAKVAISPDGRITHLRVLRLAYPQIPNSLAINAQSVDSIKQWHQKPTIYEGKPVAVCSDVSVIVDLN